MPLFILVLWLIISLMLVSAVMQYPLSRIIPSMKAGPRVALTVSVTMCLDALAYCVERLIRPLKWHTLYASNKSQSFTDSICASLNVGANIIAGV